MATARTRSPDRLVGGGEGRGAAGRVPAALWPRSMGAVLFGTSALHFREPRDSVRTVRIQVRACEHLFSCFRAGRAPRRSTKKDKDDNDDDVSSGGRAASRGEG